MRLSRILVEAFVTGFSGAAMPGPVLVATLSLAAARGWSAGPQVVVGHFLLEVSLVIAVAGGLAKFLSRPDAPVVRLIGLVGGLMLWLMAADMLRHLGDLSLHRLDPAQGQLGPVAAGFWLSAANPYFWLWWATIGLGLLTSAMTQRGRAGAVAFYTGHISSDLAWYSLVAALMAFGGRLLRDSVYRALLGGCAAALLFFGARFVLSSCRPRRPAEPVADAA
ncbi:MAG: LysE family transporter [Fimbriimonadaceae bacterium]|nr:LysE family transporter [Fimbriimonadaceae bacterium]